MVDWDQIVKTKWTCRNRDHYEQLGYVFTGINKEIEVKAKELPKTSKHKIHVTCDYCGIEYVCVFATIGHSKDGEHACGKCASIKSNNHRRENEKINLIERARKICIYNGYDLLTKEEDYCNAKMNVEFICPKHGKQIMMLDNLIHRHKCRRCSYEERGKRIKKSASEVEEIVNNINGNNLLNAHEYLGANSNNLKIRCVCGRVFKTSLHNYINRNQNRCSYCSQKESVAELRIRKYLEEKEIKYQQEKRFDDCRDKRALPFDFYLPTYNTCIEFDGRHHFEPIRTIDQLNTIKRHDEIKNQYCIDNNIQMIRIPYYNGNDIEQIINDSIFADEDIV